MERDQQEQNQLQREIKARIFELETCLKTIIDEKPLNPLESEGSRLSYIKGIARKALAKKKDILGE